LIREAIQSLVAGQSLTMDAAAQVMEEIMEGGVTPAQFGAFVTALRLKGETVDEIAGLAKTMRVKAVKVTVSEPVVDVVGTGGDGMNTFNISTATIFVVAGAGLKVAKHGNRAASSQAGSADVLEALGIKFDLSAEQVQQCIEKVGIGFMFAPGFHPATKFAVGPRREIGFRTVFNILGPLTNPALAKNYLIGVADSALLEKMALVLQSLGGEHALVVHGKDGLDEITSTGESLVYELKDGKISSYTLTPGDFGVPRTSLDDFKGGTAEENATTLRSVLSGEQGPHRDVVLMNTAAALIAGNRVDTIKQGMDLARVTIDSKQALVKLEQLIELSQSFT